MSASRIVIRLSIVAGMFFTESAAGFGQEPDKAALIRAGEQTIARLAQQPASWTAITRLSKDARIVVKVISTPTMRQRVVEAFLKERKLGEFQIIERDGYWYVTEAENHTKYRPFEALFALDAVYLFLFRAELRFLSIASANALGNYERTDDGVASYLVPPEKAQQKALEYGIGETEKLWRLQPKMKSAESIKSVEQMRAMLKGTQMQVDVGTAVVTQYGTAERRTTIQDFTWLDQTDAGRFAIDQHQWEDLSDDPTSGDLHELTMIRYNPSWRPGMKSGDGETCLMNVHNGQYRRIPFEGIACLPGCFLTGRKSVVVTGLDDTSGFIVPCEIDLCTGANRRLGGDQLAGGNSLAPSLSPDGKSIAILHKKAEGHALDQQIFLIDLESGMASPVGKPNDMAFLSWLPNGKQFIVRVSSPADPSDKGGKQPRSITLMELDGKSTSICEGDMPLLLNDGKTVLFRRTDNQGWQTYDLESKEVQTLANGMKGYGFPTASPDGKSLLWISWNHGDTPAPEIVRIGDNSGKTVVQTPGLWNLPAWR